VRTSAIARLLLKVSILEAVLASPFVVPGLAQAATSCGPSNGHTLCVTVPDTPLTGPTPITITNDANSGTVIATWIPTGKSGIGLITKFAPSPGTNDYSFVWPTQKYLDASGVLRVQHGSTGSSPVDVPVTLSNGNSTDFQHTPNDWANFLPNPSWTAPSDPVIAAVGDGASDEPAANGLAQSIALSGPDLFLYLGDIYQDGTFTENLNHYGQNSMDGGSGSLWGQMGRITQPTMGDHEAPNRAAWRDYFHGRPVYTSFRFANVLFLDLASAGEPMGVGSAQYNWVQSILTSTTDPPPPCIVAYFQNPALAKSTIKSKFLAMWTLLTDNGGDLVLNGNIHTMIQYKPLNDQLQLPSPGQATMVQLISGAGGHSMGGAFTGDSRVEWSKGKTPGAVYLTLNGAANGGTPTGLSWAYKDKNGNVLHTGTRDCGGGAPPPAPPTITGFSPTSGPVGTSVTIDGSGFTGATDVKFNGTSVGSGFAVNSDTQITATVPSGATTGPISVITPAGTGTSANSFTVTAPGVLVFTPDADTWVQSDLPNNNYGGKPLIKVDNDPIKQSLLRFTVSGVGGGSIANVTLRLYCTDASTDGGTVYQVADNSWQESTVTWNTAPAAGSAIGSLGAVAAGTWEEIDVSSFVVGDGTYSIEIAKTSSNAAFYESKEGTAGFAPQLVVTLGP